MPPTRRSRPPAWLRRVQSRQERVREDPEADQYADEFYGSRLIRWRNGTLSTHQLNQLVTAVWPYSVDGDKLVILTPKHDDEGAHHTTVYLDTRAFILRKIDDFVRRLEHEHGRLENAVKVGAARGLPKYIRSRVVDRLRLLRGRDRSKSYPPIVPDPKALRQKVAQIGLCRRDRQILKLYQAGVTLTEIGLAVGCSESNVRKRVRLIERDLGLPPRPPWQRRARTGGKGYGRPEIGSPMIVPTDESPSSPCGGGR